MFITKKKYDADILELENKFEATINAAAAAQDKKFKEAVDAADAALRAEVQALFEAALASDRAKRYDSTEPFVEIISETFSEEGGVQLRLDWNAPFVSYLKRNGFTGPTDEAIVDNWLVSLSRERIAEGGSEFK